MLAVPKLKCIINDSEIRRFQEVYTKNSGLAIPFEYLKAHRVFGVYHRNQLIGGYILGNGPEFRTIQLFAQTSSHDQLKKDFDLKNPYTEICCYWIHKNYQTKTSINFFIWMALSITLKMYGHTHVMFGTNSRRLAALYATTKESKVIHRDRINNKNTFIFKGSSKNCISGIFNIVLGKAMRTLQIRKKRLRFKMTKLFSASPKLLMSFRSWFL